MTCRILPWALLVFVSFGAVGCVGCAGTTGQIGTNVPQMSQPQLAARNNSAATASRNAGSSAESSLPALEKVTAPKGTFLFEPYVQLGDAAPAGAREALMLRWVTPGGVATGDWVVETRPAGGGTWQKAADAPTARPLTIASAPTQTLWHVVLKDLTPGALFDYRVLREGKPVFIGRTRARRPATEPHRFAVLGDCGDNTPSQKRIAFQMAKARPDFVFITGDIVYDRGRASEYMTKFFPIYNADRSDPKVGASLLRSTLFLSAAGNHDLAYKDLDKWPDGLAYFYYWDLPRNGPDLKPGERNTPAVKTGDAGQRALREASGDAYPRMANYSFDYGNAHWTVLDSNYYADWTDPELRAWLEKDLAGAQKAVWRFVSFHHPPFHSSDKHQEEQKMRVLCDLLEKYRVDIVWSGHVHNYQRTYPLRFAPKGKITEQGTLDGEFALEKTFDGKSNTRANAPIYIVTGAGGAGLYDRSIEADPGKWQPFTAKYVARLHSFTLCEAEGNRLTVRQVAEDGTELDKFVLTK